jgi:hypothetical protein
MSGEESGACVESGMNKRALKGNHVVLKGIIVPKSWNKKGEVTAVSISTFDEKEIPVYGKEKELSSLLRETVEAEGILFNRGEEQKIRIIRYRLLETPEIGPGGV